MPHEQQQRDHGWTLVSQYRGIRVYKRHPDRSRVKTFRGVMRMELADEYALVALANDYERLPQWLHFVRHVEEIQRNGPLLRWLHFTTDLPWPLHDRETVLRLEVEQRRDDNEDGVLIHIANAPDLLPDDTRYLRIPTLSGTSGIWRLPGDELELFYELTVDPGGQVPPWLTNLVLRDAPLFTLDRLRRLV
ncbi:MAG: hypothetical protein ACOC0Q_05635, partial [Wenzhouxiangella sp.]